MIISLLAYCISEELIVVGGKNMNLFDKYQGEGKKANDIKIGEHLPELFVSDRGEVLCYTGIYLKDSQRNKSIFMQPYYMHGKHSFDKTIAKEINSFYRIENGCIVLDDYVDTKYGERSYKKVKIGIRFPAVDTYYGVMSDCQEDEMLTRAVFGLTYREIQQLLEAYAKVFGVYNIYMQYPRLTRSKGANYCELTGVLIPEKFPYITFDENAYDFSHVSLWGFYRHLQLLTRKEIDSPVSKMLLQQGVDEELLNRIFDVGLSYFYQEVVNRSIWERE